MIIEKIFKQLEKGHFDSNKTIAICLASICNPTYKVAFQDISVRLDHQNKALIAELITTPRYQYDEYLDDIMPRLEKMGFI